MRSNATPFSSSAIAARCTNGQSSWLMRVLLMRASLGLGGGTQGGEGQRTRLERERAVTDQGVHDGGSHEDTGYSQPPLALLKIMPFGTSTQVATAITGSSAIETKRP